MCYFLLPAPLRRLLAIVIILYFSHDTMTNLARLFLIIIIVIIMRFLVSVQTQINIPIGRYDETYFFLVSNE